MKADIVKASSTARQNLFHALATINVMVIIHQREGRSSLKTILRSTEQKHWVETRTVEDFYNQRLMLIDMNNARVLSLDKGCKRRQFSRWRDFPKLRRRVRMQNQTEDNLYWNRINITASCFKDDEPEIFVFPRFMT